MPPMGGLDLLFERVDQRLEALHLGLCGLGPSGLGVGPSRFGFRASQPRATFGFVFGDAKVIAFGDHRKALSTGL